ncbi:response regulator transcription factor [Fulvivirgaceae bacterium BMA10]|uniref:Response regulator transcription factor n=1 Tax=Splendidivirga corallicola TaxID=3051826 RepID=A0ABT8KQF6_9BACT|nr:response regulator transcription factor [Fulvivirgaceae bacterium BMA10]
MKLLLIEDDQDLGKVLAQFLELQGFQVVLAQTGEEGINIFQKEKPDICVLDIMLPDQDGFDVAKFIRSKDEEMPFLFLTAKNQKADKLKGLKLGADDYISKPFEPDELVLRIKNILKRYHKSEDGIFKLDTLTFNFSELKLSTQRETYTLTLKEAELLRYFINNKNKVLKRDEILMDIWGENDYFLGRSMDVFISRLRKYLSGANGISLETVRQVGYVFKAQ